MGEQSSCLPCAAGKWSDDTGRTTACDDLCAAGHYCEAGSSSSVGFGCAPGYSPGPGNRCYKYVATTRDWLSARSSCTADGHGADLATITSSSENAFVRTLISNHAWIGANDRSSEGSWKWSGEGASSLSYTAWWTNEPNDSNGEDCAMMYYVAAGNAHDARWNDGGCEGSYPYVCSHLP